jgi:hypothetical protein
MPKADRKIVLNVLLTDDVAMIKIGRLIFFTYIEPVNLIGYLIHRTGDKQFTGHCWNPYTNKVYTLKDK